MKNQIDLKTYVGVVKEDVYIEVKDDEDDCWRGPFKLLAMEHSPHLGATKAYAIWDDKNSKFSCYLYARYPGPKFTIEKWREKMNKLTLYLEWELSDSLNLLKINKEIACLRKFELLVELAKEIKDVGFLQQGFDGVPGLSIRCYTDKTLDDLWDKVKDIDKLI